MGLLTIIKKQKLKDREVRVLVLGLDNAGKTTITRRILSQEVDSVSPTVGFEIHTLIHKNHTINIWDIGGQSSIRAFWGNYFDQTNIVIWVIDVSSIERMEESFQELHQKVLEQDRIGSINLLILVNKIDMYPEDSLINLKSRIRSNIGLQNISYLNGKWDIKMVSGLANLGIDETVDWIVSKGFGN